MYRKFSLVSVYWLPNLRQEQQPQMPRLTTYSSCLMPPIRHFALVMMKACDGTMQSCENLEFELSNRPPANRLWYGHLTLCKNLKPDLRAPSHAPSHRPPALAPDPKSSSACPFEGRQEHPRKTSSWGHRFSAKPCRWSVGWAFLRARAERLKWQRFRVFVSPCRR